MYMHTVHLWQTLHYKFLFSIMQWSNFTSKSLFFFKMFLTLPYRTLNFPQTSPQTRLQDKTNSFRILPRCHHCINVVYFIMLLYWVQICRVQLVPVHSLVVLFIHVACAFFIICPYILSSVITGTLNFELLTNICCVIHIIKIFVT